MRDQYRRAASYVDRILKGEKPADLPVQAATKYEQKVIGLTGALRMMQDQSWWELGVVALGLLAFGLFEIIKAYAREVHAPALATKNNN